jgi:hypothetical protein
MNVRLSVLLLLLLGLCVLGAAGTGAALDSRLASAPPPPRFRPAPGWVLVKHGPSEPDISASQVWAITRPDVAALSPVKLFTSLTRLRPRGIAIWALTIFPRGGPSHGFPPATLPLRLSSFRVDYGWEGQPNGSLIQQPVRVANIQGWRLDVRVYFATEHPDTRLLGAAQAELDRLLLPASRGPGCRA